MKLSKILSTDRMTISCELFPPKEGSGLVGAHDVVRRMAELRPAYMSITYGAGGGTSPMTVDMANEIQNVNGVPVLAHLTCASSTREQVESVLDQLRERNIENILALRGDIPQDADFPLPNQYRHASELMREISASGDFCIGGACYPEGHPESSTVADDIENLKYKVDAGCSFLTTQMFFDNNVMYNYLYKLLKAGISVPVVAGIMPVTNGRQIKRICALSATKLPARFIAIVDRFGGNPDAMRQAGIAYATEQIIDLVANGVNHIHIYSMNRPEIAGGIMDNLSEIIEK